MANAAANLRLALYSLKSLQEIREETGIEYDLGTKGVLKIYRNPEALADARRNCAHAGAARTHLRGAFPGSVHRSRAGAGGDRRIAVRSPLLSTR